MRLWGVMLTCMMLLPLHAKTSKYRIEVPAPPARFLNGFAVGFDGVGFGMKALGGRYANMEVMGRLNLLEKYFPVVELGIGECDREGNDLNTTFHTRAPYFRAGGDYCLTKKRNGNRLLLGLRYGFSSYDYDYANPDFQDPYWETRSKGTVIKDIHASSHWLELSFGIETRLWRYIRMGWSFRYKSKLAQSECPHGEPWYVPGYGKNGGTTFGGTVHLAFELQPKGFNKLKMRAENK